MAVLLGALAWLDLRRGGIFLALPFAATMTILLYLPMSEHGAARRTECGAEGDGERLGDRDTHREVLTELQLPAR
jgi:hypothetical protein